MADHGIMRRIQNMVIMAIGRCVLRAVGDDAGLQKLQVSGLAGETLGGIDRVQNYGVTSHPLPGAQGIMVSGGGMRDNAVVIALDDNRYRVKLLPGEVALYDDQGQSVTLKRGRVVEISGGLINIIGDEGVAITSPTLTHNGINVGDTHAHRISGGSSAPGPTGGPQ